ncbi:MAG: SPOR domain-containing protein [Treponema sp.]|nr:SPOR domain-containing protein [Treponema sp.]
MRRLLLISHLLLISFFSYSQENLPSRIIGRIPDAQSPHVYHIQVGAFIVPQNAQALSRELQSLGLSVTQEPYFNFTRVLVVNIYARDVPNTLGRLKSLGIDEVIIREGEIIAARERLTEDVQRIILPDIFEAALELGVVIHEGTDPPNIEGTFEIRPLILISSNFPDELEPGHEFNIMQITFSDQDNENLTIIVETIESNTTGSGLGSFITGSDNKFTVYTEVSGIHYGYPYKSVEIQSGEIGPSGITNYYHVLIITEEAPLTIRRGEGRMVYDGDGFSERLP